MPQYDIVLVVTKRNGHENRLSPLGSTWKSKSYDKFIYAKYIWDPDRASVNKLSV